MPNNKSVKNNKAETINNNSTSDNLAGNIGAGTGGDSRLFFMELGRKKESYTHVN